MAEADMDDFPRDDVIKFNIQVFLPYICDCVKATDLLVHLQYFTREQRKDIFKTCAQNSVQGMRKAMEVLMNEVEDDGRFIAIRNAIEDSRYPKIVKMIDGNIVADDNNYRKIIDLFAEEIIDRLSPAELLPNLVSQGTLTRNDADEIRAEERNHGSRRACWVLLFHLPNRVEDWFRNFMEALLDCKYDDIAEILDPDMFQKLMVQREDARQAFKTELESDIREDILEDDNFDNTIEKDDFAEPEKDEKCSDHNVYKTDKKISEKSGIESLVKEINVLSIESNCKQVVDEAVTEDVLRSEGVEDVGDSLTEVKQEAMILYKRQNTDRCKEEQELSDHSKGSHKTRGEDKMSSNAVFNNVFEDLDGMDTIDANDQSIDFDELLAGGADTGINNGLNDLQNDLGNDGNDYEQNGEVDFNIVTDEDEVGADDKDVELREYQKELAKEGCEGENVIVMAPTNTGKTRVAWRIMQVHLRRQRNAGKIGKVIFLVENEALAFQQGKDCAKRLPAYRTKVISGSVQRDQKQYLRDFIDRRDIMVVTAQVLLNALKQKEIDSITRFSMIVFDECHHTDNYHRFNEIMSLYMHLKLRGNLKGELPQIVGLTASLGVGGNTRHDAAMGHMKSLLANLDAKFLCTVRRNKEELKRFENNPIEKTVAARKRVNDRYRKAVLAIMDIINEYMISHPSLHNIPRKDAFIKEACVVPPTRGSEKFQQWLSEFKKALGKLSSDEVRRMMNPCRLHLEHYNKALLIHADARIKDAEVILEDFMEIEREINPKNDTDVMLLELYDNLKQQSFTDEPENPKLVEMQTIVMQIFDKNEDARGIIFVKTRELAQALVNWMKQTAPLDTLNASEFVGQAASKAEGGMTKVGQKDVLEYFDGGRHKIIIATSVAEEGLDITKCNLVIRYEHVTNEIVRLQSRGRARRQDSRYYVLTEEGSWIVAKEEKNALLEKIMNAIVPELQVYIEDHPNLWEKEMREMQEEKKLQEELKEEERRLNMSNDEHEFRCLNCNHFICFLSDIRKIQEAHHVVVDEAASTRLISYRNPHPRFIDDELKFDGAIFCGNIDCQRELGGVCEYRHAEFPLLKIKNFRVVNKNGQGNTYKQWKKANFNIEAFTLDDLRRVVERRRDAM
ncbi:antiviral innate immune response receptor RIG-I-like [Ruditapes philippinarum]|uniref:antiviral innate immune response receptor RIG-I-like n=1 Tax=Ruditapes philippinarum TaxID=129788 RepID=UPI00295B9BBB|nr:antiviral innate immune response receptor RIG-I-like [Ruditapes philippinarum]XP_060562667.1 antiviral innate immune response receptor RIG-I-like [Ruditapes philippinarum]XP_060562668.1 antiviral innate immune response receptor RIG-I-like [Ruditapes philippinarum]XP_060562669.1 antiviral innate immune response receptor RIG-I-like [Ruditapes philippinarum]